MIRDGRVTAHNHVQQVTVQTNTVASRAVAIPLEVLTAFAFAGPATVETFGELGTGYTRMHGCSRTTLGLSLEAWFRTVHAAPEVSVASPAITAETATTAVRGPAGVTSSRDPLIVFHPGGVETTVAVPWTRVVLDPDQDTQLRVIPLGQWNRAVRGHEGTVVVSWSPEDRGVTIAAGRRSCLCLPVPLDRAASAGIQNLLRVDALEHCAKLLLTRCESVDLAVDLLTTIETEDPALATQTAAAKALVELLATAESPFAPHIRKVPSC